LEQAIAVFINGITGVFAAMAVLYVTIRFICLIAERTEQKPESGKH